MFWLGFLFFLLLAVGCFGFAVVCGSDPEGRAGSYMLAALGCTAVSGIAAAIFLVLALHHALKG